MSEKVEPIDADRARAISPGEIECCGACAAARACGMRDLTLLGWRQYHASDHYGRTL